MSNIHGIHDLPRYQPQRNMETSGGAGRPYFQQPSDNRQLSPEGGISMMVGPPSNDPHQMPSLTERCFPRANWKSATAVLSVIQVIIFIVTLIVGSAKFDGAFKKGNELGGPSAETLHYMGGKYTPDILDGAVWRLLTPIFLHAGILHILGNLFFQLRFGFVCEARWGIPKFLIVYFITGIHASLWSAYLSPKSVSVGASGALFGVVGADAAYLAYNWDTIPHAKQEAFFLAFMVVINLLMGIGPGIDNYAHLGGLIFGLVFAVSICPHITIRPQEILYRIASGILSVGLMLLFLLLLFVGKPQ